MHVLGFLGRSCMFWGSWADHTCFGVPGQVMFALAFTQSLSSAPAVLQLHRLYANKTAVGSLRGLLCWNPLFWWFLRHASIDTATSFGQPLDRVSQAPSLAKHLAHTQDSIILVFTQLTWGWEFPSLGWRAWGAEGGSPTSSSGNWLTQDSWFST